MDSRPVRVPEDTYFRLRQISGFLGDTPGELVQKALNEYLVAHRDELVEVFDHAKKFIASGDIAGLTEILSRGRRERARQAAAAARKSR